jgi:hypothetical protein
MVQQWTGSWVSLPFNLFCGLLLHWSSWAILQNKINIQHIRGLSLVVLSNDTVDNSFIKG